jgi:hypothetical protein
MHPNNIMSSSPITSITSTSASCPSICIPRAFPNITEARVRAIFRELGWGTIERIDFVERTNKNDENYLRYFIHFSSWAEEYHDVRDAFMAEQEVKVVYDDPWYWRLSLNKGKKHTPPADGEERPKKTFKKPTYSIETDE